MRTRSNALVILLAAGTAQTVPPDAGAIVAKASAYVAQYESRLGGLVAEEDYTQKRTSRPRPGSATTQETRRLKSDFMLVKFTPDEPWIPFRDVIAVDGEPVGDRAARLEQLFLQPGAEARQNASRISAESARYNLGSMYRTINLPVLALEYLKPPHEAHCRFSGPHRDTVDYQLAWRLDYRELDGPTVIQDGRDGSNVPANGTIWIRESDGAVMRTILRTANRATDVEIDVKYCQAPSIAVLVPCRMSEHYYVGAEHITGTATYRNIRQFKVTTTESIKH